MAQLTALERRSNLLAEALKDKSQELVRNLTQPKPYKQIKVPEDVQVRKYLQLKETGGLNTLREQVGDEQVNNYARAMQGRAQKQLNMLAEKENIDAEPTKEDLRRDPSDPIGGYYTADDDLESF